MTEKNTIEIRITGATNTGTTTVAAKLAKLLVEAGVEVEFSSTQRGEEQSLDDLLAWLSRWENQGLSQKLLEAVANKTCVKISEVKVRSPSPNP